MESRVIGRERFRVADLRTSSLFRALKLTQVAALVALFLAGCGPQRLRQDFTHYENSYAVTSNREVLLNLARLRQHDPTYFFKLGQISSSYRMEAALTGSGNLSTVNTPPATTIPTGGGSPTFLYENDPSFSFVPVNDQANAQLLLQPVSEDIFYSLYQQGWRVDQLFRLMVDRMEITLPLDVAHPEKGCRVEIIRNVPPPAYEDLSSPGAARNLSRYISFLRISAMVYELQKHGLLQLGGPTVFAPLNRKSALDATGNSPKASDIVEAATKNQVWQQETGKNGNQQWLLGAMTPRPAFELSSIRPEAPGATAGSPAAEQAFGDNVEREKAFLTALFKNDPTLQQLSGDEGAPELTDILEILYSGFAIGGSPSDPNADEDSMVGPCVTTPSANAASHAPAAGANASTPSTAEAHLAPAAAAKPTGRVACRLVMRSLIGLMAASAEEEQAFDRLMIENPVALIELKDGGKDGRAAKDGLVCSVHKALIAKSDGKPLPSATPLDAVCNLDALPPGLPTLRFNQLVPAIEQLPVLRLTWDAQPDSADSQQAAGGARPAILPTPAEDHDDVTGLGLSVNYRKQFYWITDADVSETAEAAYKTQTGAEWPRENQYWNRDMFRLINQLSAQVTVDISKFPLPEILQLRTE